MKHFVFAALLVATGALPALAGGLIGDIVNKVVPGAGTALDKAHDRIKKNVPPYGQAEEAIAGAGRKIISETAVETTWPLLTNAINLSRGDALRNGVQPIPEDFKQALAVYFPRSLLDTVRYRIGGGGDLTLQVNAFRYGHADAIALFDIIVFRDAEAFNDLWIWAHELGHVQQYKEWGLNDFAKRYIRDHQGVEDQADRTANTFANAHNARVATINQTPMPAQMPQAQQSNICRVPAFNSFCIMPVFGPPGVSCWCPSGMGTVTGFVSN